MGQSGSAYELNVREKSLIADVWAEVQLNKREYGAKLVKDFLEWYPQYRETFSFLCDKDGKIVSEPKLYAHALTVVSSLASLIDSFDDPETLHVLIEKAIVNHRKRNVGMDNIKDLEESILRSIASLLDDEKMAAWKKAFGGFNEIASKVA